MGPHLLTAIPATPNRNKIIEEYGDRIAALPGSQEFLDGIVGVYAKYYSDEDVQALAEFYATPAGQHFNQHSVDVQTDSMKFGQQLAAQSLNNIAAEICEEYPAL